MPRKPGKNKLAYKIKNDGTTELLEPIHATSVPKKNEQTKKCVKRLDYNTRSNPKKVRATSVSKVVKQTEKCVNKPKETGTTSGRRRKTSVVAKLWEIPTLNVQKKCVRKCGKKVNFNCRNSKKCSVAASPKTVDKTDQQDSIVITVPIPDKGQKDATEGVNKLKDQNILSHAKNGNATAVFNDVDQTCEHNSTEVKVTPSNIEQKDSNNCVNKLNVKDTPLHSKKDSIPAISKDVDQTKKHKSTEVKETTPDIEKKDTNHNTSKCVNDLKAKDSPLLSKKGSAPAVPKDVGQTNEQNSTEVKVTTPDIEQKDTKNYIENCQQRCLKNCNKYQERRKKCSNCREADYQKIMETCLSSKAKWKSKHRMFLKSDDNNKGPQSSSSSKSHTDVKPEIWVKSEPVQREGDTGLLTSTHYNRLLKHLKPGLHPSKVAAPIVDTRLASLTSKAYPRVNTSISRVSKVRWPTRKPENEILESLTLKWQVFGREKSVLGLIRDQRCNEAQGYSNNELNMSTSKENSKAAGSQRNEFSMKRKRPSCTCCHTTDRLVGGTKRRRMEEREGLSHSEARPGLLNSSSAPMTSAIKRKGVHCGSDCSCREATKRQKGSEIVQRQETISKDMPSQAVGNSVPSTLHVPQPKQSVATQTANTEGISKSEPVPIEVHNIDNVNDLHQDGNKFTESSSELGLNVLPSVSETNIHSDMDSASECEKNTGSACDINNTPIATTEPNFSNKTSRNDVAIGDKESTLTEGENRRTKVPAPMLSNTTEVLISEKEAKLSEENSMKKNAPKTSLCNTKWLLMADDVSTMTKGNSMMRNTPELHLQMLIADTNARNDALKVDKELGMTKDTRIKKKTHRQVTSVNSKKSSGSEPCTGGISCTCNDVIKSQENGVVTVYRDTVVTTDTHSLTKNTVPKSRISLPNSEELQVQSKDTLPKSKHFSPKHEKAIPMSYDQESTFVESNSRMKTTGLQEASDKNTRYLPPNLFTGCDGGRDCKCVDIITTLNTGIVTMYRDPVSPIKSKGTKPKAKANSTKPKDSSQKTKDTLTKPNDISAKARAAAMKLKDKRPKSNVTSAKLNEASSMAQDNLSKTEDNSTKSKGTMILEPQDKLPKPYNASTNVENTLIKVQETSAKIKDTSTTSRDVLSMPKDTLDKCKDASTLPDAASTLPIDTMPQMRDNIPVDASTTQRDELTKPNATSTKPKDTLPLLKETIPKPVETSTEYLLQKQEQTKANMIKDVLAVDVFPHQEETGGCLLKDDTTEKCLPKLDIVDASVKVSNVRNSDAVFLGNHTVKHNEEQDLVENNTMSCDTNIEVVSLTDKCLSPCKKAEPNMIMGNTTEDVNTTNPEDDPLEENMNHNVSCVANHVTELQTHHSVASLQNSVSLESHGVVNGANDKCLPQESVRNIETVSSKDQSVVPVTNDECALSQDESVEPIKNLETVPQDNHSVGPVTPMPEPACVPLLRSDETVSLQDQSVAPMRNNRPVSPELQSVELLRTIENVSSEAQNVSPLTRLKCSKDISLTNGQDTIEQIQNMDADDQCVPRTTALKCSHDAMSRKESELNGSKKELSQTGRGTVTVDRETEPQNSECVPVSPVEHSSVIAMMPESLNLNQSCSTWSMKPLVLPCFKDSMMHQKYLEAKQALENTDTGLSYDSLPSSCSPVGLASVQSTPFSRHSPDQILTSFQSTPALPRRPMSRYSPTEEAFESFRRNKLARFSADLLLAGSVEDNMMLAPDSTVDISGSFSGSFSDKPGSGSEYTATPIANDRFNISDPLLVDIDADLNNDVLTTCQDLIAQLPTDMNFTFPEDDLSGEGANNLVLSQDSVNLEHNQGMFTDTGVTNGSLKENKRSWKHREEYQSKRPRSNLKTNRTPRFEKHFPTALPKVKYQKTIINEKKLYDDAERFLGDFNEKDKRSCRSRPVVQYTESMATHKASKKMELSPSTNAGVKLIEEKISTISSGIYKHNKEDTKYGSLDRNKIAELKSSIKQVEKEIKHLWIITRSPSAVSTTQDEESDEEPIPTPKKRNPKNTTPKKKTPATPTPTPKRRASKKQISKTDIKEITSHKKKASPTENRVKSSVKESSMATPKKSSNKSLICKVCKFSCNKEETLQRHYDVKHSNWCDRCNEDFDSSNSLELHQNKNHDVLIYCGLCDTRFCHKKNYTRHLKSLVHQEKVKRLREANSQRQKKVPSEAVFISSDDDEGQSECSGDVYLVEDGVEKKIEETKSDEKARKPIENLEAKYQRVFMKGVNLVKGKEVDRKIRCKACRESYIHFIAHCRTNKHHTAFSGSDLYTKLGREKKLYEAAMDMKNLNSKYKPIQVSSDSVRIGDRDIPYSVHSSDEEDKSETGSDNQTDMWVVVGKDNCSSKDNKKAVVSESVKISPDSRRKCKSPVPVKLSKCKQDNAKSTKLPRTPKPSVKPTFEITSPLKELYIPLYDRNLFSDNGLVGTGRNMLPVNLSTDEIHSPNNGDEERSEIVVSPRLLVKNISGVSRGVKRSYVSDNSDRTTGELGNMVLSVAEENVVHDAVSCLEVNPVVMQIEGSNMEEAEEDNESVADKCTKVKQLFSGPEEAEDCVNSEGVTLKVRVLDAEATASSEVLIQEEGENSGPLLTILNPVTAVGSEEGDSMDHDDSQAWDTSTGTSAGEAWSTNVVEIVDNSTDSVVEGFCVIENVETMSKETFKMLWDENHNMTK